MSRAYADLPLHYGKVPRWLADRMTALGGAIIESVAHIYGRPTVLVRLSDPLWFQALGCVLGMDWHSSGITTSVMGALKRAVNPKAAELGIYICGGRGKHSRDTPTELLRVAEKTGLPGDKLVHASKLTAKVDNTAIQDGFNLYLHNFVVTVDGEWTVVQQGLNDASGMARRYHWHSKHFHSYFHEPHVGIAGRNQGLILNLTHSTSEATRAGIMDIAKENPDKMMPEIRKIILPKHHDVRQEDVNLKRLGSILTMVQDQGIQDFESMLLLPGLGPRALQSLTLVSEVIHGTPSRFADPARFSFAHGGKDGHPFPVPLKVYDETITTLKTAVENAKLGQSDKLKAIESLHHLAMKVESDFTPNAFLDDVIAREREESHLHGGMTVMGPAKPPKRKSDPQLRLF